MSTFNFCTAFAVGKFKSKIVFPCKLETLIEVKLFLKLTIFMVVSDEGFGYKITKSEEFSIFLDLSFYLRKSDMQKACSPLVQKHSQI